MRVNSKREDVMSHVGVRKRVTFPTHPKKSFESLLDEKRPSAGQIFGPNVQHVFNCCAVRRPETWRWQIWSAVALKTGT